MKIWEAMLIVTIALEGNEEKYITRFQCDTDDQEYEVNSNSECKEWICSEGWVCDRVPMDMVTSHAMSGGYKVTQGFDHELSETELKEVEAKMRIELSKYVNMEKEYSINRFNSMLSAISETKLSSETLISKGFSFNKYTDGNFYELTIENPDLIGKILGSEYREDETYVVLQFSEDLQKRVICVDGNVWDLNNIEVDKILNELYYEVGDIIKIVSFEETGDVLEDLVDLEAHVGELFEIKDISNDEKQKGLTYGVQFSLENDYTYFSVNEIQLICKKGNRKDL